MAVTGIRTCLAGSPLRLGLWGHRRQPLTANDPAMQRRDFLAFGPGALILLARVRVSQQSSEENRLPPLLVRLPAQVRRNASLVAEVLAAGNGYLASDFLAATKQITLTP